MPRSTFASRRRFPLALSLLAFSALLLAPVAASLAQDDDAEPVKKDVPYVPTPQEVVDKMIEMAEIKEGDIVYDLGCGDGRMIVTAAKKHGARGIGVDIDPQRIRESNENAKKADVTDKVKFIQKDLFTMDFKDCDALCMYLLPSVNLKLRPKILELKPGTRILSHAFDMDDWEADETVDVDGRTVYKWVVPAKVDGTWTAELKGEGGKPQRAKLNLKQEFQKVTGTADVGGKKVEIKDAKLKGDQLTLALNGGDKPVEYVIRVNGGQMEGQARAADGADNAQQASASFKATREGGAPKSDSNEKKQDSEKEEASEKEAVKN